MKIQNIAATSFGNNQQLDKNLKKRLSENPNLPTNKTIYKVNQLCNQTEKMIKFLEGDQFEDIDKNEDMINMLLDYFISAKIWLAQTVNKIFPDLNYIKTECDTYHYEHEAFWGAYQYVGELESPDDDYEFAEAYWRAEYCEKPAYGWRDMLSEQLAIAVELNDEDAIDKIGVTSSHVSFYPEFSSAPANDRRKSDDTSEIDGLVEKYSPTKSSPKSLDDVIGLDKYKSEIEDLIVLPLKDPEEARLREEEYGVKVPHFIILYGPPGCGKTMIAQAIKAQTGCDMYKLDLSRVGSAYVNESSKNITEVFDYLTKEAENAEKPILVFVDEMDSLLAARASASGGEQENNKVVDTLLQHIQDAKDKNIIIIGATNVYDIVDNAVKNRANKQYYIGLPDDEARIKLLKTELSKFKMGEKLANDEDALNKVAIALRPYSPRSIVNNIMEGASLIAYRQKREVRPEDIIQVVETNKIDKVNENDYKPKASMNSIGFNNI